MRLSRFAALTLLLLAGSVRAQMITLLSVDESTNELKIEGAFSEVGTVTVGDTSIDVSSWTDSLITLQIPREGKGSYGLVKVEAAAMDSAWLTKWDLPVEIEWQYVQRGGVAETEKLTATPRFRLDIYNLRKSRRDVIIASAPVDTRVWYYKYDNGKTSYRDTTYVSKFHGYGGHASPIGLSAPLMFKSYCNGRGIWIAFDSSYSMHVVPMSGDQGYGGSCMVKASEAMAEAAPPFIAAEILSVMRNAEEPVDSDISVVYDLLGREIARYSGEELPRLTPGTYLVKRGSVVTKVIK